jgi:hypothetical protein
LYNVAWTLALSSSANTSRKSVRTVSCILGKSNCLAMAARLSLERGRFGGSVTRYWAVTDVEKILSATSDASVLLHSRWNLRQTRECSQLVPMELLERGARSLEHYKVSRRVDAQTYQADPSIHTSGSRSHSPRPHCHLPHTRLSPFHLHPSQNSTCGLYLPP